MENTSTYCKSKAVKRERPSAKTVRGILAYSRSLAVVKLPCRGVILIVNN